MTQFSIKIIKYSIISIILIAFVIVAVAIALILSKQSQEQDPLDADNQNIVEDTDLNELVYDGEAPVYVTIYTHNEDSWSSKVNTKEKYIEYRQGLLDRINLLAEYEIEWDWQSDQPVVQAMVDYENDPALTSQTDGKNILVYMQDLGVSLDPHAHTNNYADIAYLIAQMGAKASSVIGGLKFVECGDELLGFMDLTSWHDEIELQSDGYVYGTDYPQAKWKPEVLSDPGMGQHYFDDFSTGVWRPGDEDKFYTDQGDGNIIYIGEGYPHDTEIIGETHAGGSEIHASDGQYVKELVDKIKNREFPTGNAGGDKFMYTASIHVRDTAIVSEDEGEGDETVTIDGLKKVLDELMPYEERGEIVFVTFEQAADIWQNEYNSIPWSVDLSDFKFYEQVLDQAEEYCTKPQRR